MTTAAAKKTKRVLVTGATGFTGGALARALVDRGYEVHALIRGDKNRLNGLGDRGVIAHRGDLTDRASVEAAVAGADVVYHIGAAYRENVPRAALEAVNVEGTRYVMDAAKRYGVERVVHCSTVGVHGHVANPPATEDAPFDPSDDYQQTKAAGERLAAEYQRAGLPVVIFRPVGMYGPGDTRFLKLFRTIKAGQFIMFGDGSPLYQLTYIDDMVAGILACGEHPKAVGRTYIVSGSPAVALNDLVAEVAAAVGVPAPRRRLPFGVLWGAALFCEALCRPLGIAPPLYRRRADWFRKSRSFDSGLIKRELGWEYKVGLKEGLRRTAAWYRAQKLL